MCRPPKVTTVIRHLLRRPHRILLASCALFLISGCEPGKDQPPTPSSPAAARTPARAAAPAATDEGRAAASPSPTSSSTQDEVATVAFVVDGDTLEINLDGRAWRLRLILVDTPEVYGHEDCYGQQASARTKALLPRGTPVRLERDVTETDRYGRLLRYVYLPDGRMLNEILVAEGYARIATFPPDVHHVERIRAAEASARLSKAGLWAACPTR